MWSQPRGSQPRNRAQRSTARTEHAVGSRPPSKKWLWHSSRNSSGRYSRTCHGLAGVLLVGRPREREHVRGRDVGGAGSAAGASESARSTAPGSSDVLDRLKEETASQAPTKARPGRARGDVGARFGEAGVLCATGFVQPDRAAPGARAPRRRSPRRRPGRPRRAPRSARRSTRRRLGGAGTSSSPRGRRAATLPRERERRHAVGLVLLERVLGFCLQRGSEYRSTRRTMATATTDKRSATSTSATTTSRPPLRRQVGHRLRRLRAGAGPRASSQGARPRPARYTGSLEIGAGTGYFSLNLLQSGVVRDAVGTDISPGMLVALECYAPARAVGRDRAPATPRTFRSRTRRSTSSSDTRCSTTCLTSRGVPGVPARAEAGRTLAFSGEPSHYGDLLSRCRSALRSRSPRSGGR